MAGAHPVEGTTRVAGIFGDPVSHSLSPRMHNAAFRALGLDYVYVPFRPSARTIRQAVAAVRLLGLAGVNVTVPFKEAVVRHVDRLSETAKAVGAVNTIYPDRTGKLVGDNTDVVGFAAALEAGAVRLRGLKALVVGAGGGARAAVYALLVGGAAEVVIANRTLARGRQIVRRFSAYRERLRVVGLTALREAELLASRGLVVNATSLGIGGTKFLDFDFDETAPACVFFDLAYGRTPTAFLAAAAKAGRPTIDGREMLLHQGAAAFKHFTGREAPLDVMSAALIDES
jgi:shikimate dehydrogenase